MGNPQKMFQLSARRGEMRPVPDRKNAHHEGQGSTQPEPKNRTNEFVQAPLDV